MSEVCWWWRNALGDWLYMRNYGKRNRTSATVLGVVTANEKGWTVRLSSADKRPLVSVRYLKTAKAVVQEARYMEGWNETTDE